MKVVECDSCDWQLTEQEYEDFPECPNCWGHYMTVKIVDETDNKEKSNGD